MAIDAQTQVFTIDEFERYADSPENVDRWLELIDGVIVEKSMPTHEHGIICGLITTYLNMFVIPKGLGLVASEARHKASDNSPNARQPDIAFSSSDAPIVKKGSVKGMPDLAIEVRSPDDSVKRMRNHARYYLENGSRMVWLVYPASQTVEVYTSGETITHRMGERISGGDVLPGFELPLENIFTDPRKNRMQSQSE